MGEDQVMDETDCDVKPAQNNAKDDSVSELGQVILSNDVSRIHAPFSLIHYFFSYEGDAVKHNQFNVTVSYDYFRLCFHL